MSCIFTFRQDNLFDELYLFNIIVQLLLVFFLDLVHGLLCYLFESLLNIFRGIWFWFHNLLAIKGLKQVILSWIVSWNLSLFLSLLDLVSCCRHFTKMDHIDILNGNALELRKYIRCFLHRISNLLFGYSIVLFRSTCWRFNFVLTIILYFILPFLYLFLYLIVASVWLLYFIGRFFVIVRMNWVSIFILSIKFDFCILLTF